MSMYDYAGALRRGKKRYQENVSRGEYPFLPVLDDILMNIEIVSEVNLGLVDIPLERIVGTRTKGRTQAFASNFMPLLRENTEFADKWAAVYEHQVDQGIYDPVEVFEFMNRYYVQEGNKRVSVLKYVHAYSVTAMVTRLVPRRTNDRDIRLYYEFLDFYQVSFNSDIWFSKEGGYQKLMEVMGKEPGKVWPEEERKYFSAVFNLFAKVFSKSRPEGLKLNASDAFLQYVEIFGYDCVKEQTERQMKQGLVDIRKELELSSGGGEVERVEQPEGRARDFAGAGKLFNWLLPTSALEPDMFRLAFIYPDTKETSSWCYGHDLGRAHLEKCFGKKLYTCVYDNARTPELAGAAVERALADHCNMIFTVAPQMALPCVKAAVQHPEVKFFNCSVHNSYSSIDTYFARVYESKFLMGALAAAISGHDKLGYIADFPLYGMSANVNAFAVGASMINPRAKVYLKWSGLKEHHAAQELEEEGITYISGDDMITPAHPSREYGLFHKKGDGTVENLATPMTDWGRFYEQLIRLACRGALDTRAKKENKAVNYWWGMSANVVDLICSKDLPVGTKRLISFLEHSIKAGAFHPFYGKVYAKNGIIVGEEGRSLTAQEIIRTDWMCRNVVGEIPDLELFQDEIQPILRQQGHGPDRKQAE